MSRPWMPLYWGDFLRDTRHLSTLEIGAYFLLIGEYWNKGKLPDNEGDICRVAGLTKQEWRWHRDKLKAMFDAHWRHKRIDAEIEKAEILKTKRQIAGMRGGLSKRGNTNRGRIVTEAIAKQLGKHPQSQRDILSLGGEKEAGEKESKVSTELMEKTRQWRKK